MSFKETAIKQARKMPLVEDAAFGQRFAISDSVHTARYNYSLCDYQLLALELWMHPHSSTQMKVLYLPKCLSILEQHTGPKEAGSGASFPLVTTSITDAESASIAEQHK